MRKVHVVIIISILMIAIAIGILVAIFPIPTLKFVTTVFGWILLCIRLLYEKWDKFYMFIQKIKYKFFGLDTLWNLTVRYELGNGENILSRVRDILLESKRENEDLKINQPFNYILEAKSDGVSWQFIDNGEELEVHLFDLNVTYNKAARLINKEISPRFQQIENKLSISKKHYFLSVGMDKNPFIGLFMSKIAAKDLINFDIIYTMDDNRIEVHKDKIVIQTESITELTEISKDFLAISLQ